MPPKARLKTVSKAVSAKNSKGKAKELSLDLSASDSESSEEAVEESLKPAKRKGGPSSKQSSRKRARASTPDRSDNESVQDLQEENERLRASLSELQESFESLQQKRQTGPEAALKKLQQTSDARVSSAHDLVEQYKREVEQLHATLSQSIPKGSKALNREIQQKDAELAKIKRELQSVRSNVAERDQTIKELQQELSFEVSQSKSLMNKTKAPAMASANSVSVPAAVSAVTAATATTSNEQHAASDTQAMLDLSTDLTGLLISSTYVEAEGQAFECLLSDVRGRRRDLAFKLVLHPRDEYGQQSVSYLPKIDKERDKEIDALLEDHFKTLMRFDRSQAGRFFRKAWLAVCK